jgi:hypothetical protein
MQRAVCGRTWRGVRGAGLLGRGLRTRVTDEVKGRAEDGAAARRARAHACPAPLAAGPRNDLHTHTHHSPATPPSPLPSLPPSPHAAHLGPGTL